MYFDQLSGAACTWKLVKTFFFSRFQAFLFNFYLFQWFHAGNQQKRSENEQKKVVFFPNIAYSVKLVDMRKLVDSLMGYLAFVFFQLIFYLFRRFSVIFDWFKSFFVDFEQKSGKYQKNKYCFFTSKKVYIYKVEPKTRLFQKMSLFPLASGCLGYTLQFILSQNKTRIVYCKNLMLDGSFFYQFVLNS